MRTNPSELKTAILERLGQVIDPETGADVVRMQLIDHLDVKDDGRISYTFRPSSPLCPIAVYLVKEIKKAIAGVPGVTHQEITVTGYVAADELTELINRAL